MKKPFVVGITGGSGSGKTSFARKLAEQLHPDACLIASDNYYHPVEKQPLDPNGRPNFDLPESLDLQKYAQDLGALKAGLDISGKEYTFNVNDRLPRTLHIPSRPVIIAEGLFIFHPEEILPLYDLKLFIEAGEDIRLKRRLIRDTEVRGYTEEDVLYCQQHHVLPSYLKYIRHLKDQADMIISNNKNMDLALDVFVSYLKKKII